MQKVIGLLSKINVLLVMIFDKIGGFLGSLVPSSIKNFSNKTSCSISDRKSKALDRINERWSKGVGKIDHLKDQAKSLDLKQKITENSKKTFDSAKALNYAKVAGFFTGIIAYVWANFKGLLGQLNPNFLLSSLVVGSIGIVSGIQAFKSTQDIVNDVTSEEPTRVVASIPSGRAAYYKGTRKQIFIADLKVPMYLKKDHKDMKSLRMEFVFETNTRFSKKFIEAHEYEVRDKIFSEVEPMGPKFLLKPEGKGIIKLKIKQVLNQYLEENNIQGRVKEVSVDSIIGG